MGWNDSSGGGNGKDPWGNRGKNPDGPPDLDEIVRKMQQGFGGIFGRRGRHGGGDKDGSSFIWILVALGFAILVLVDMTYTIDEQERGIVLRFGEHVATLQPGLNFRFPRPIEEILIVNVGQERSLTHKASMLTRDENIVDVEVAVQWRISDPHAYKFNVYAPEATLHQATESAVRDVIGKSDLDFVLTEGRSQVAQSQLKLIQQIMDDFETGILIIGVEMQAAKPPDEVKAAFDDAIKAREDEQRLVNEAEAYSNDIIPKARGRAARLREEANAYEARVIAKAEGEASRFEQLLAEYEEAPSVTRERLYLDTMESVLGDTNKVFMDTKGSNNLMYIPIDRILKDSSGTERSSTRREFRTESSNPSESQPVDPYSDSRSRGTR